MDSQDTTTTQDKQVTIDVPEDRLAEFYAFYSRFLAVGSGRRGRGAHRPGGYDRRARHAEHGCGHREQSSASAEGASVETPAASVPDGPKSGSEPAA